MTLAAVVQKLGWWGRESAAFAWLVLLVAIFLYVLVYDLWAYTHPPHRMMTTQFRLWLTEPFAGPVVLGCWGGIFLALTFHFIVRATEFRGFWQVFGPIGMGLGGGLYIGIAFHLLVRATK